MRESGSDHGDRRKISLHFVSPCFSFETFFVCTDGHPQPTVRSGPASWRAFGISSCAGLLPGEFPYAYYVIENDDLRHPCLSVVISNIIRQRRPRCLVHLYDVRNVSAFLLHDILLFLAVPFSTEDVAPRTLPPLISFFPCVTLLFKKFIDSRYQAYIHEQRSSTISVAVGSTTYEVTDENRHCVISRS